MQLHAEPIVFVGVDDTDLVEIGGGLKGTVSYRDGNQRIAELFLKFVIPHLDTGFFWQDIRYWFFDAAADDECTNCLTYTLTVLGFTLSLGLYWDR